VISINCDDILVIDRNQNGAIGATLRIYDDTGRIVVELDKGYFRAIKTTSFA
jgi:hypothetical protein